MINYLKDIKKETLIGQLPDVINSNNDSIRKEFNWMFDSSLNRLTKSVYAPTGSVKAHFGEFVNLSCEYLTIKNEESIKNSIQSTVNLVIADSFDPSTKQLTNHNILNHRFIDSQYEGATDYMHDAASIVYEKEDGKYVSVKDVLDHINNTSINDLENSVNEINTTISNINKNISVLNTNIKNSNSSINDLYSKLYKGLPYIKQNETNVEVKIDANTYNVWRTLLNDITISPSNQKLSDEIVNEYKIRINYTADFKVSLNFGQLKWALPNGAPIYTIGNTYEISIIDGLASYIEYTGEIVPQINLLFDGIDLFNYKKVGSYNDLNGSYPTYISSIVDADILAEYTNDNICTLYTLSNAYMFIPQDDIRNKKRLKIEWHNSQGEHEIKNTSEIPEGDYAYNSLFNCDTIVIKESEETSIYYVKEFQLQDETKINAYIIKFTDVDDAKVYYKNSENNFILAYSFNIMPAQYPHLTQCGIAMSARQSNFAEFNDGNTIYPKLSQYDINLIRKRYNNEEIKYYLERYDSEIDGNIITSNEDLVLHYQYTITGFKELDDIIKECSLQYINGEKTSKDEYVSDIKVQIQESGIYTIYTEYCDKLFDNIDNGYLDYILYPSYNSNFDDTSGETRGIDFGKDYKDYYGFIPEAELGRYPLHAMILSYDWQDEVENILTPGTLFIRYSQLYGSEFFGLGSVFDGEIQFNYGDNLADFEENNYNPGVIFEVNDNNISIN